MKTLFLALACSAVSATAAFAQTQTLALSTTGTANTSGTFSSGSAFSLDATLTFTGYTADGLSYWLQVPSALAPFISITSETYFTFTDPTNGGIKTFASSTGADFGFLSDQGPSNSGDLGGSATSAAFDVPAGTYKVSTLNFSLSAGAPNGTYLIKTTTLPLRTSVVADNTFATHSIPGSSFSLTVIPEPSTVAFLVGGLGLLGANLIRRNRKA